MEDNIVQTQGTIIARHCHGIML